MIGMGYTLGWDLIEYIAEDEGVCNNTIGLEDAVTNQWLSNRTDVLRIGDRLRFHDPPERTGPVSWSYRCDDIVIHQLKTKELWDRLGEYYINCCSQINNAEKGVCQGSAKSSTCCTPALCDRECAPSILRPVEVDEFQYISDEDLSYLTSE